MDSFKSIGVTVIDSLPDTLDALTPNDRFCPAVLPFLRVRVCGCEQDDLVRNATYWLLPPPGDASTAVPSGRAEFTARPRVHRDVRLL